MDIYSTTALNRLVQSLDRPQSMLLDTYFPELEVSDTEDIKFDVETKRRRIAPFVSPLREGKLVEDEGYVTKSFTPAYVKDKRVHDPNKALKRRAGETIGGSLTPLQRHMANVVRSSADQLEMLTRRKEVMASEILRTGKVTISGEGYPTVVVDFGRNAAHTVALLTSARWGESGVSPWANVKTWVALKHKNGGGQTQDVIMDPSAWALFEVDPAIEKGLDTRPLSSNADSIKAFSFNMYQGLAYQGQLGGVRFWTYVDWYIDDAGAEQPMLPEYTVLLVSRDIEGVQHHGVIRDEDAGLQPLEYFQKSWVVPDPSKRILLMQSAPLVVPYRPDASFCATVR